MRCTCTLNTFDTMDYDYLNAIRARALMWARNCLTLPISEFGLCSCSFLVYLP
jgi:hypothetical protein